MPVVAWWTKRTPENRQLLRERCAEWITDVVCRTRAGPGGQPPQQYVFPADLREAAREAALAHLDANTLACTGTSLAEMTEGFFDNALADDSLADFSFDQRLRLRFPEYVGAVAAYHLLARARTAVHRHQAGQLLIGLLRTPLERTARERLRGRNLSWTVDQALDGLLGEEDRPHRLVRGWIRNPPDSLTHALAQARTALSWEMSGLARRQGDVNAEEYPEDLPRQQLPVEGPKDTGYGQVPDLLEELWPVACQAARGFPRRQGRLLLPWLMLGGISHHARPEGLWLDQRVRHLVQPTFIRALQNAQVLGPNFVQQVYRREVSRLMEQHGLLDAIRRVFLRLLRDRDDWHPLSDAVLGCHSIADLIALGGQRRSPQALGWDLFIDVGRETARRLRDGVETAAPPPALASGVPGPVALTDWLETALRVQTPERAHLSWVAQQLCACFATGPDWVAFLRTL
jgi:hypothetical protein